MTVDNFDIRSIFDFREVIHGNGVLVWISDKNRASLFFNQAWLSYTGKTLVDQIGDGWKSVVHSDDLPHVSEVFEASFHARESFTCELRLLRHDGEYRWQKTDATPYFSVDGEFLGYIGNCIDIDDFTKQKQELFRLNQQLELIIEGSNDGLWIRPNSDKEEIWFSPRFYELLGYEDGEFIASREAMKDMLHPDDRDRVIKTLTSTHHQEGRFQILMRIATKSGEYKWFLDTGVVKKNDDAKSYRMTGSMRDITDEMAANEAVEKSEAHYKTIYNNTPVMLHSINPQGVLISVSDYWLKAMGYERKEVIGRQAVDFLTEQSRRYALEYAQPELRKKGYIDDVSYQFVKKNGERIDILLSAVAEEDIEGEIKSYLGALIDVTEQYRSQRKLKESEERFQLAVAGSTDGLWDWDIVSDKLWYSDRFKELLGKQGNGMKENFDSLVSIVHSDEREEFVNAIERHKQNGDNCEFECRFWNENGGYRWFLIRGQALWDENNMATRMSGSIKDIHSRKLAEQALFLEKEKAIVTLTSIGDAVITTDISGIVEFINPVAEKLTGYRFSDAVGKALVEIFNVKDEISGESIANPVERCMEQGRIIGLANHTILTNRDGTESSIEDSAAPIRNETGEILGVVLVFKDVTETRRMAREISHQASHDHLTGLVNRREFERRLKRIISTAQEEGSKHAVCYLDLDQFKVINDTCGHSAGDELLRQLSIILNEAVRKRDTIGRLGGDEFGILMEHCGLGQAKKVAEKILQVIDDFRFTWDNKMFSIGTSIGLVPISLASESVTGVLRFADAACYIAKEQGRNRVHVYREDDETLSKRQGDMQWVSRINRALEDDAFLFYCQLIEPSDRRKSQRLVEVLIRLQDEADKVIAPGAFLPAAEQYGLSQRIDRWVVDHFMRWYQKNRNSINPNYIWCINLSGLSLGEDEFLHYVLHHIEKYDVPGERLCFEITETAAIANLSSASRFFKILKQKGCSFSLDDFGSGLSSFAYLKNLQVDYLKIDGMFVRDINDDPIYYAMVKSISEIGHVMGKKTIVEFVENREIYRQLKTIKTDFMQGFELHEPCPIGDVLKK